MFNLLREFFGKDPMKTADIEELFLSRKELNEIHKFILDNPNYNIFDLEAFHGNNRSYVTIIACDDEYNRTTVSKDVTDRSEDE